MELFNCSRCKKLITEWYVRDETKPLWCSGCGYKKIESYYPSTWRLIYTLQIIPVIIDGVRWKLRYGRQENQNYGRV